MSDVRRVLAVGLSALLLVVIAYETLELFRIIDGQAAIGTDLDYYRFVADRWRSSGIYYTDEQLSGPYVVQTQVHNLYPPHALYLFVPFLYLPDILWWVLPLAVIAYVVWWCRPTLWGWPLLLAILALPKGPAQILFGNTDMWLTAFVAGAVRWGWPSVLVSIKPSLALFAGVGILTRAWWIAAVALVVVSLPFWQYWVQYPVITGNSSAALSYSFGNYPFFLLPIVAWVVSSRRGRQPWRTWLLGLLRGARSVQI